ncbi:MAG TPA: hypothetical protein VEE84_07445, partial [Burkholderiaceae bacterium]|nr:hypothetical protein [Burkholderiaceae bacterium]
MGGECAHGAWFDLRDKKRRKATTSASAGGQCRVQHPTIIVPWLLFALDKATLELNGCCTLLQKKVLFAVGSWEVLLVP